MKGLLYSAFLFQISTLLWFALLDTVRLDCVNTLKVSGEESTYTNIIFYNNVCEPLFQVLSM